MSTRTICECGHAIHEHTYSEDFSGCDIANCECSLDLGRLVDLKDAELLALREREAKLENQLKDAQKVAVYFSKLGHGVRPSLGSMRLVRAYEAALKSQ